MASAALDRRSFRQNNILGFFDHTNVSYLRFSNCKGAGFIESDGLDLAEGFQGCSAFNEKPAPCS